MPPFAKLVLAALGATLTLACGAIASEDPTPAGEPLTPARTAAIMELLLDRDAPDAALHAALDDIEAARDQRFVAVLIELQRAGPSQLAAWDRRFADLLNQLTGQIYGNAWDQWVEWYGRSTLQPPPGFATWKGRVLSGIDPRFTEFLHDDLDHTIRIEQIAWGGVPVDGIATLQDPPILTATQADYLDPDEPVFGVIANGEARAYPLRIMDPHELVNDTLGGVPISLAYCTLCGTGLAFDTRHPDGSVLTFGTSGLLYQSNKLMYDHQTGSLWNQFTGRPVVGPRVAEAAGTAGPLLNLLPLVITRWQDWSAAHPDTTVLDINTGQGFGYTLGYPYLDYFSSGELWFPVADRSVQLGAKEWVFGLDIAGQQKAYSLAALIEHNDVLNDTLGATDLAIVTANPLINVSAVAPGAGELEYQVASEVRAYARPPGRTFHLTEDPATLEDDRGLPWQLTEEALTAEDGTTAPRIAGHTSFWFGWFQFFPRTDLFGARFPAAP